MPQPGGTYLFGGEMSALVSIRDVIVLFFAYLRSKMRRRKECTDAFRAPRSVPEWCKTGAVVIENPREDSLALVREELNSNCANREIVSPFQRRAITG